MQQKDNETREALNARGQWYERHFAGLVPRYGLFSLPCAFLLNFPTYWLPQLLMRNAAHTDLTTELDRRIPFCPAWVLVYFGCYLVWCLGYLLVAQQGKKGWFRYASADLLSRAVCAVFFIAFPTTMVRPELTGSGFIMDATRFLYMADAPTNLFPSLHCLLSTMCWIGVRGNRRIPRLKKIFFLTAAVLVYVSTLLVKQHVIVDVFAGILLAEAAMYAVRFIPLGRFLEDLFDRLDRLVFRS